MSVVSIEDCACALEAFIRSEFQVRDDDPDFDRHVNLWEEGYVDSTGLVEVISFLEERFEITFPDEMLFSPDFTSIAGMAKMVVALKALEAPSGCADDGGAPNASPTALAPTPAEVFEG